MKADCRHHYLIPVEGVAAIGRCKHCGHEKIHLNSPEELRFNTQARSKTPIVLTNQVGVSVFAKVGRRR